MYLFRKIKSDRYLRGFVRYCRKEFGKDLIAVVIFGSYAWGYFDKRESDYDVFVILSRKTEIDKRLIMKRFPKISLQYLLSTDELIHRAHFGHWASYITLLMSVRVLYSRKKYKKFLRRLRGISLFDGLIDVIALELESGRELEVLKRNKGFRAAKWALPMVRKRLQLLTYIRGKKLVWNLNKNLKEASDVLSKDEIIFMQVLDKKVRKRSNDFGNVDKKIVSKILRTVNKEISLNLGKFVLN